MLKSTLFSVKNRKNRLAPKPQMLAAAGGYATRPTHYPYLVTNSSLRA